MLPVRTSICWSELDPSTSIIDVAAFALDVEALTGFRVDVVTDSQQQSPALAHILVSAVLL